MFNGEDAVIYTEQVHMGLYFSSSEIIGRKYLHLGWLPCEL